MKTSFGPWATAIDSQPQLGTFWKRRMSMLPNLRVNDSRWKRLDVAWLFVFALSLMALPLVRFQLPLAAEDAGAKPVEKGKLLVWKETKFVFVTPDGKELGDLPGVPKRQILNEPVLSPDGKRVAFTVNEDPSVDEYGFARHRVLVLDCDGKAPGLEIAINALNVAWTPDGKALLACETLPAKELKDRALANWLVDIKTKQKTRLDLPKLAYATGITPDGKSFIATVFDLDARKIHLALVSRDGKEVTKLTEVRSEGPAPKLSPDGATILFQDYDPADKREKDMPRLFRLFTYDVRTKNRKRLEDVPLNASIIGYTWSPDGKKLAYAWKQAQPGVPLVANNLNENDPKLNTETESHLVIADAEGKNPKTIMSMKGKSGPAITIGGFDWK